MEKTKVVVDYLFWCYDEDLRYTDREDFGGRHFRRSGDDYEYEAEVTENDVIDFLAGERLEDGKLRGEIRALELYKTKYENNIEWFVEENEWNVEWEKYLEEMFEDDAYDAFINEDWA